MGELRFGSILIVLLFCIVLGVSAYDANEYTNEFSEQGETCQVADIFEYRIADPWLFDSEHYLETIPVFYSCCKEKTCNYVVVDVYNHALLNDDSVRELIDLNYIKYSLTTGKLSTIYFISNGVNSCSPYGDDTLAKESINFVADTTQKIAETQKAREAKEVVSLIKFARVTEIISPFNVVDFGLSVACNYNNKMIKKAIERLAECNMYLSQIQIGFARSGYVYSLNSCFQNAQTELQTYLQSTVAQVKGMFDFVLNSFKLLFKLSKDFNAKIDDTEYQVAQKTLGEIQNKKVYLSNPDIYLILGSYHSRIALKSGEVSMKASPVYNEIISVSDISPSRIVVFFTNIFFEPNYNISEGLDVLDKSKETYNKCIALYNQAKYNSALACLDEANSEIETANPIIMRETNIKRGFGFG